MKNDILIIPDVHGRTFWKEPCSKWDGKIIFLGDYFDPYSDVTIDEALKNGEELITMLNDDRVIALAGNHDCHYIMDGFAMSTRFSYKHCDKISQMLKCMPLKLAHQEGNFLFTHAGVTNYWAHVLKKSGYLKENIADDLNKIYRYAMNGHNLAISVLSTVGHFRGGYCKTGSCLWADANESIDDVYGNFTQVVGHTRVNRLFYAKDINPDFGPIYYTDCQRPCVLTDNKIIPYE